MCSALAGSGLAPLSPREPCGLESFRAQTVSYVVHMNRLCKGYGMKYTAEEYITSMQAQAHIPIRPPPPRVGGRA